MNEDMITVFCLCDDMLKALPHSKDPQCLMSDVEVMTTAITAALSFRGEFRACPRHAPGEQVHAHLC